MTHVDSVRPQHRSSDSKLSSVAQWRATAHAVPSCDSAPRGIRASEPRGTPHRNPSARRTVPCTAMRCLEAVFRGVLDVRRFCVIGGVSGRRLVLIFSVEGFAVRVLTDAAESMVVVCPVIKLFVAGRVDALAAGLQLFSLRVRLADGEPVGSAQAAGVAHIRLGPDEGVAAVGQTTIEPQSDHWQCGSLYLAYRRCVCICRGTMVLPLLSRIGWTRLNTPSERATT